MNDIKPSAHISSRALVRLHRLGTNSIKYLLGKVPGRKYSTGMMIDGDNSKSTAHNRLIN